MKKTITLFALALSLSMAVGCKNDKTAAATENTSPDNIKTEVMAVADKFHTAFKAKKADDIKNITTDPGVFMGTDPEEVYNQQSFINYLIKKLGNPAIGTITYEIDRRETVIDENGNGATLVDQFTPVVFTQNIPWRMTSHLIKKDGVWKFDFISLSMIPKNDVVPYINMAAHKDE